MSKPTYLPPSRPLPKRSYLPATSSPALTPEVVTPAALSTLDPEQLVRDLLNAPPPTRTSLLARWHLKSTNATADEWAKLLKTSLGILDTALRVQDAHHKREMQRVRHDVERAHAKEIAELEVQAKLAALRAKAED